MSKLLGKHLADGAVSNVNLATGAIASMDKVAESLKNVASGFAVLDAQGKILASQLPNSVMEYQGMWDATSGAPSATPNAGDVYRVNVAGTFESIGYEIGDYIIYSGSAWEKADNSDNELRNDLASVAEGQGASLIGVEAGTFTATDLQGVVVELDAAIDAEVTNRDAAIEAAILEEVTARDAAIEAAILEEVTARDAAIGVVASAAQVLVQEEASARVAADLAEVTNRDAAIEAAILEEVTARDAAIAAAVADVAPSAELITLTEGQVTAKAFDLASAPNSGASIVLFPLGGLPQSFGDDFGLSGSTISWTGLGMDSLGLVAGDKIRVIYFG
jgi:hypothetical protein